VDGLVEGDEGGRVWLDSSGRRRFDYPISPPLQEALPHSHRALAELLLAAGAEELLTFHRSPLRLRGPADLSALASAPYGAHHHSIFSAHVMGGCAMGPDLRNSVVGPDLRHHDIENLFVVDGSVLPTALGVNPSQTIYALAHRARATVQAAAA
jgi:choline dehydrogenase-like flavoprotein